MDFSLLVNTYGLRSFLTEGRADKHDGHLKNQLNHSWDHNEQNQHQRQHNRDHQKVIHRCGALASSFVSNFQWISHRTVTYLSLMETNYGFCHSPSEKKTRSANPCMYGSLAKVGCWPVGNKPSSKFSARVSSGLSFNGTRENKSVI